MQRSVVRVAFACVSACALVSGWLACGGGDGGITTGSGLVITHIAEGKGAKPEPNDVVEVHYHGTFLDGKVFDSSVERGMPARFPLDRVIACWTEGVGMMRIGGKAKLVCPPEIAYGAQGGGPIPPDTTLVFEVELLDIQ
jgi:FKBP-type peptidyl-prolyl cis-trans isomerase FkpA